MERKDTYKWRALALLWVAFFLQQGMRQIYGPLLGSIQNSIGATSVEVGRVASMFTLLYGLCIPFAGFASDLFRRKWMVVAGVGIFSTGIFFSGYVSAVGMLVITYGVINGIGQPFYYPSSTSLIAQLHSETKATAISILQLAMYIGIIGCSALAGWFADLGENGWRIPFRVLGALGIVWAVVLVFLLRDTPPAAPAVQDKAVEKVTFVQALKAMFSKPAAVLLALGLGMQVYVDVGFKTWMPDYLYETFKVSRSSAGLNAVLWHYLGAALGIMIGSRLGDRLVKRRPTIRFEIIAAGLVLAVPFLIWMSQTSSYVNCCVAMAGFGLFRGVYDSNNFAAFFDVVAPRYHASATGFNLMIAFMVASASPVFLAWMKTSYSMSTGLATLAGVYLAGAAFVAFGKGFFRKAMQK